jgi:hypothetical protein
MSILELVLLVSGSVFFFFFVVAFVSSVKNKKVNCFVTLVMYISLLIMFCSGLLNMLGGWEGMK